MPFVTFVDGRFAVVSRGRIKALFVPVIATSRAATGEFVPIPMMPLK